MTAEIRRGNARIARRDHRSAYHQTRGLRRNAYSAGQPVADSSTDTRSHHAPDAGSGTDSASEYPHQTVLRSGTNRYFQRGFARDTCPRAMYSMKPFAMQRNHTQVRALGLPLCRPVSALFRLQVRCRHIRRRYMLPTPCRFCLTSSAWCCASCGYSACGCSLPAVAGFLRASLSGLWRS